jgi:hypothetical protein
LNFRSTSVVVRRIELLVVLVAISNKRLDGRILSKCWKRREREEEEEEREEEKERERWRRREHLGGWCFL